MKIGIITIHYGINYGSALQCFALSKYLGITYPKCNISVINYIPERYRPLKRYFSTNKSVKGIKKAIYLILSAPNKFRYQLLFDKFLKKNIPLGRKMYSSGQVEKNYTDFDLLITGSDQIWNTDYNGGIDPLYYLTFGNSNTIKISYAASCGKDWFDENELTKCISLWKQFDEISLREDVTKEAFQSLGFSEAKQVLDPVFLLSQEDWKKFLPEREIREPYVFIYSLEGDEEKALDIATKIAQEKRIKVAMISYGHIWNNNSRVDYYLRAKDPFQFLSLLENANYVVTNSFHGVAFSIRFRKQFIPIKRKKYNNRLDSILRMVKLEDRLIEKMDNVSFRKIDYQNQVDKIIKNMEIYSKNYLEKWINSGNNS